uniref:NADH-ubiquinone oxidoreductase chain 3 n=1 Tax=Clymenella torquata TaxID=292503 RepID=Q642W3_CLYTO|nr:NADH dehydrogenase subunit 3 [Clymenella torquata]AAU20746.1 NADH dehydrogenase subunit 3 [Clymenella torquata]
MNLLLFTFMLSLVVSFLLILIWFLQPSLTNYEREKLTSFECGFDPMGNARTPFSLRFFLLAVIFLVFDIEIVLLLPMPILYKFSPIHMILPILLFLLILLAGTAHEYNEGSLDWSH